VNSNGRGGKIFFPPTRKLKPRRIKRGEGPHLSELRKRAAPTGVEGGGPAGSASRLRSTGYRPRRPRWLKRAQLQQRGCLPPPEPPPPPLVSTFSSRAAAAPYSHAPLSSPWRMPSRRHDRALPLTFFCWRPVGACTIAKRSKIALDSA
jgi:hypothetical protein